MSTRKPTAAKKDSRNGTFRKRVSGNAETKSRDDRLRKAGPLPNKVYSKNIPSVQAAKKAPEEHLTPAQKRILLFLAECTRKQTRKEIGHGAGVDIAYCTSYIGSSDPEIRANNDRRVMPSLLSAGFVEAEGSRPEVYSLTAAGRRAAKKLAELSFSNREAAGRERSRPIFVLHDHEAWVDDSDYVPEEEDSREVIERQIKERRGQQKFRDALRGRYGDRCLVTGCQVLAVLEAAHISPYRGERDNNPTNGVLLRADIHTLFDLNLIGIEPGTMRVKIAPELENDEHYARLEGTTLHCSGNRRPSRQALQWRFDRFQQRLY